jgi:hypothetical protein
MTKANKPEAIKRDLPQDERRPNKADRTDDAINRNKGLAHEDQDAFLGRGRAGNEFQADRTMPSRPSPADRRER